MIVLDAEPIRFPLDASVYLGLVALAVVYVALARGERMRWSEAGFFGLGLVVIWGALETPLDPLGDQYLQSAHMLQHMLLMVVAAPLLVAGLTPGMAQRLLRWVPGLGWLSEPVAAQVVYALVVLAWHVPPAYDLGLENETVHILEHLTFLVAGGLYWWPVVGATSSRARWRLSDPQKIVYVFIGMMPMMLVSLSLQFSRQLFYAPYAEAPRLVSGISPVLDQTIAGIVMMSMDMASSAWALLVIFYRWMQEGLRQDLQAGEQGEEIGSLPGAPTRR
ncbi:MAG TPA: cytochrome c oxidase assembly protein [Candidatus Dormibacteraeota bacterium]|nr:cytochrome c oxidase assembly protein [Candidatus Dormibacteraeota bacterium]